MSQLITINLSKGPGTSWGFRLQGGKDFAQPLCIQKVNVGSVAELAGLQAGDAIVSIGNSDALTLRHKEAQDTIVKAGNSFPLVVQRGAMTWRPQVTALAQPKKTATGPVVTQTSLAASGKQPTKTSPRVNIGSSHNNSPRPFPGSGTWASTPLQSPVHQRAPVTSSYCYDTPTQANNTPHSLSKSSSSSTTNGQTYSESVSEIRSEARSMSRGSLRGLSQSPARLGTDADGDTSQSSYAKRSMNGLVDTTMEESYKSTSNYSSKVMNSTNRSVSGSNLSNQLNFKNDSNDLHHAAYTATEDTDIHCASPSFPSPPPPLKLSQSPRVSSPTGLLRTPSPSYYSASNQNNSQSNTATPNARSNRSPSPYYISNNSRTPRSVSPSCSIPSLHSNNSVVGGSSVSGSPPARTSHLHDPVSDLDVKNSLKIAGADISLDKENARNFIKMQLEKERGRDCSAGLYVSSGTRRISKTASKENFLEEQQESHKNAHNEDFDRTRKFSQDSRHSYKPNKDCVDSSFKHASNKNYFKSSDNLFSETNLTNADDEPDSSLVTNASVIGSVSDNIRRFDGGRRHSSFVPPQSTKRDYRCRTLDRSANANSYRSPANENINKCNTLNNRTPTSSPNKRDASQYIRRTAYSGSCMNLSSGNISPGTNCNVPWKNHFSNLRRKSGSALLRGPPDGRLSSGVTHNDGDQQQRAPKGFNAVPAGFGEVNGQPIVNPQYNSPINLYNEDNIAEALSAQSEVLGKGCLGINFRKFDREVKLRTDSPTYQMIHGNDGDSAPKLRKQLPPQVDVPQEAKPVFPAPQPGHPANLPSAGGHTGGSHQMRPGENICAECERLIVGVFVRIKDKNLHADCFKCNTCGTSLKNVGYYNISDKLYCDVHAKQAAKHHPPGPNMVPVTVPPGAVPPLGAVKAPFAAPPFAAAPALVKPPPPGGVRIFPVPTFGGPATPYKPAASSFVPAPAPIPIQSHAAPAPSAVAPGGSSANPQGFGAPAGGINVRSHIPKKGPVAPAPAPVFSAPKIAPAPAIAPVALKPVSVAPAPAPAPMFGGGGGGMPMPAPPPGMGGLAKPPGMGGPPTKGIPGERTAPKRGKGVMTPANVSRVPICANCQRQIRGPFVTALGKNWCPDHFHCATESCRKPLIDVGFVEEQGALYCEDCYEKYLAPTCGKCDKRIKGDCLNAVGKQFHPECFACAYCGKVFGSGAFYLEDGLPYCETDWNDLFTTKCVGCGFPIEAGDRWVEALNNNYHSQCFKCSKCHKNLEGQSFFAKGGKPFCKAHAQRGF